jgi:hypothetical protein
VVPEWQVLESCGHELVSDQQLVDLTPRPRRRSRPKRKREKDDGSDHHRSDRNCSDEPDETITSP